jgi:heme-degrading monooxygenase HmoA
MHARVSTLQMDSARIDDATKQLEEEDLPTLKATDGFKGFTLFADRSTGKCIGATYWETEEAMKAAEEVGQSARQRAAETGGATSEPEVERFEVLLDTFAG